MKLGQIEYVEWLDHNGVAVGLHKQQEIIRQLRPALVESVGWVIDETDDYITLIATRCQQDETARRASLIMKALIKRRTPLEGRPPPRRLAGN